MCIRDSLHSVVGSGDPAVHLPDNHVVDGDGGLPRDTGRSHVAVHGRQEGVGGRHVAANYKNLDLKSKVNVENTKTSGRATCLAHTSHAIIITAQGKPEKVRE